MTTYYYDDLNQLVRVDDPREGTIWTYSYDLGGNILNKSEYVYNLNGPTEDDLYESRNYSYNTSGWGDVLVGITSNIINKTITSDAIGNMLSDGTWNYTWQHGRQLASMTNGSTTVSFGYDASGMRTSKTVGNKTWQYVYNGSTLSYMTDGTNKLFFSYDANGPMSVTYNGIEYYYVLNAQGDVIAITNSSGTVVVTYAYDPWGDLLYMTGSMKDTLGQINPLTYRGYVYDHETGLYYLQSRYYNPEMCRFINADGLVSTGQEILGFNMFAYCNNNPVMGVDYFGTFDLWGFVKGVGRVVAGVAAIAVGVAVCIAGAPAAMIAVAAVTITAGALTATNGAADIQQSITGNNFVRDSVFSGNQTAYNNYSSVTETVAAVGSIACGGYLQSQCTMKGAVPGTEDGMILEPGTVLDRYGSQYGRYLTDTGTPASLLDLPASNTLVLNSYRVLRPFYVSTGIVAGGGGFQYFSWMAIERLIRFGFLELL